MTPPYEPLSQQTIVFSLIKLQNMYKNNMDGGQTQKMLC